MLTNRELFLMVFIGSAFNLDSGGDFTLADLEKLGRSFLPKALIIKAFIFIVDLE